MNDCLASVTIILLLITREMLCLTMEGIIIPPYVHQGDATELKCQFRLDNENLYSVTWYKDHEEFYRYVPRNNPKQHSYKLEGAKIDQQRSGVHVVKLKAATPAASGVYRCEVSAEAPSFTSVHAEGRMDVVSLPKDSPEITGDVYPRDYREGDIISLNCTAGISHPPAKIRWFINDRQASSWYERRDDSEGKSVSSLRFQLVKHNFYDGILKIQCQSVVGSFLVPLDKKEAVLYVRGCADRIYLNWKNMELIVFYIMIKYFIPYF